MVRDELFAQFLEQNGFDNNGTEHLVSEITEMLKDTESRREYLALMLQKSKELYTPSEDDQIKSLTAQTAQLTLSEQKAQSELKTAQQQIEHLREKVFHLETALSKQNEEKAESTE